MTKDKVQFLFYPAHGPLLVFFSNFFIYNYSFFADFEPQEALECPMDEQIKTRRSRSKFSTYQRRELEKVFSQSPFLSMQNCHLLMQRLGISEQIIKVFISGFDNCGNFESFQKKLF